MYQSAFHKLKRGRLSPTKFLKKGGIRFILSGSLCLQRVILGKYSTAASPIRDKAIFQELSSRPTSFSNTHHHHHHPLPPPPLFIQFDFISWSQLRRSIQRVNISNPSPPSFRRRPAIDFTCPLLEREVCWTETDRKKPRCHSHQSDPQNHHNNRKDE